MKPERDTATFFDGRSKDYYSANYEAPRTRHAHNLALRRAACLELFPDVAGKVLDVGCGPGAMAIPLLERGHEVVAIDISAGMVRDAARRARDLGYTASVAVADATSLPFADGSFGVVVTTGVLEYIQDVRGAMREIARVLRPGGVVIATMSLPRRLERFTVRMYLRVSGRPGGAAQYIHDRKSFDAIVESAGLAIDGRRCCSFAPFPVDALWPPAVSWIDRHFSDALNHVDRACDHAKTYIVRAVKP